MLVSENLNQFQRGKEPKQALDLGIWSIVGAVQFNLSANGGDAVNHYMWTVDELLQDSDEGLNIPESIKQKEGILWDEKIDTYNDSGYAGEVSPEDIMIEYFRDINDVYPIDWKIADELNKQVHASQK